MAWRSFLTRLRRRVKAAGRIYREIYFAPYRSQIYRSFREQRDLFLVMGYADLLGVPNPVAFYLLELYPDLIEEFHQWHRRMGMEHPPEGGFRCC